MDTRTATSRFSPETPFTDYSFFYRLRPVRTTSPETTNGINVFSIKNRRIFSPETLQTSQLVRNQSGKPINVNNTLLIIPSVVGPVRKSGTSPETGSYRAQSAWEGLGRNMLTCRLVNECQEFVCFHDHSTHVVVEIMFSGGIGDHILPT